MQLRITDNCWKGKALADIEKLPSPDEQPNYVQIVKDLTEIADKPLQELVEKKEERLLVFPDSLTGFNDTKKTIFRLSRNENPEETQIQTGNIMGWIRKGDTQLTICSRFAEKDGKDFFLFYMLAKVFSINLVNWNIQYDKENIFDLLPFVFPAMLQKALRQGMYKTYQRREYNDANIKGAINVARHLRLNVPFRGTVCYTMREHSSDNAVTQLIRHTIEYLRTHQMFHGILANDPVTRAAVSQIELATPTYNRNDRLKVINANLKAVNHPFFTEYKNLQQLCLMILRREQIAMNRDNDDIHGILFDGAWLWEEYIAKLLYEQDKDIEHPTYSDKSNKYRLFTPESEKGQNQCIIPDFIKRAENKSASFLGDTKYKWFDKKDGKDYYQMLAYMYRFSCPQCHLIYPIDSENKNDSKILIVDNEDSEKESKSSIIKIGMVIPTGEDKMNFTEFSSKMENAEKIFLEKIPKA